MRIPAEEIWCWLWYVRNWEDEKDAWLKSFTTALQGSARHPRR